LQESYAIINVAGDEQFSELGDLVRMKVAISTPDTFLSTSLEYAFAFSAGEDLTDVMN